MDKGEHVRKKILDEFYKLACIHGYKRTSMRQLSDACCMSKGHINFYFKKKEDLMIALCEKYHIAAEKTISGCKSVPDDAVMQFLLQQLLLCYLINEKKHALHFISEMSENSIFLIWRSQSLFGYVISMLDKNKTAVQHEDIFDACLISMAGFYMILHRCYVKKIYIDHKKMFRLFIRTLFVHTHIHQADVYIDKALHIFARLDKNLLHSEFDSALKPVR